METPTTNAKNPTWIGYAVLLVSIVVVILASRVLYHRTVDLLTLNLRERILTISITAAANIDAKDLEALRHEADWTRPEWARVVGKLHKAKYSNKDVVFMYIFRKKAGAPDSMEFVADADSIDPYANTSGDRSRFVDVNRDGVMEPDGPDKLQWPGQDYPEAADIPEAFEAYDGPLTSRDLYTDAYGTVLTGYSPIVDAAGRTVAVLATDVKADDFFTITTQTLLPFVIFITFLTVVIVLLTLIIFRSWKNYADRFRRMNERLQELDRLKSQFLSFASHQLKTPLTAIKWQAELLLGGPAQTVPPDMIHGLQDIERSADNLMLMVNDFLDLRRIEEGRMEYAFERVDAVSVIRQAVERIRPIAVHKKLSLTVEAPDAPCVIRLDAGKLEQVVRNLVDNAIKYTDTGSVVVRIGCDDATLTVSVKDTGRGMHPSIIPKLFGQFVREPGTEKVIEGTGLGLHIAKRIVEAHHGSISAHSDGPGTGSTFSFSLPK
jgi:signal transduction histidine kinase